MSEQTAALREAAELLDDLTEENLAMRQEIASVLVLMDGLAERDAAIFRQCRDRLRKLLEPNPPTR